MTDETKKCPVCGAISFKDMDVCFGCLHRFEEDDASGAVAAGRDCARVEAAEFVDSEDGSAELNGRDAQPELIGVDSRNPVDAFGLLAHGDSELELVISFQPIKARVVFRGN